MTTSQPYIKNATERIADRDARAESFLQDKSIGYRATAKSGLAVADGLDRATAVVGNPKLNAFAGILHGGLSGAIVGALVGIVAIGATFGGALFLLPWIIGGSAALFAGFEGIGNYRKARQSGLKHRGAERAEQIAQMAGALPIEPSVEPEMSSEKIIAKQGGMDGDTLVKIADAYVKQGITPPANIPEPVTQGFTDRTLQSRGAARTR